MSNVRNQIEIWLKENGFKTGCFGTVGHACGLPAVDLVMVCPEYSPVDGGHTLAVTATEVLQCVCLYPSNYNDWRIIRRHPYKDTDELKKVLGPLISNSKGCWS